jgi:hypothetical protein
MALKTLVVVYWVVTPCSLVCGYKRFEGTCRLDLQSRSLTDTLVIIYRTTRRHSSEDQH